MNILIHTHCKIHATKGGTERTSVSVATALKNYYGCRCFSLYDEQADTEKEECFIDEFRLDVSLGWRRNKNYIRQLIYDNDIDIILIQGSFIFVKPFAESAKGTGCKVVFAHHFRPGWEKAYFSFSRFCKTFRLNNSLQLQLSWLCHLVLFPYMQRKQERILRLTYKEAYDYADRVVLLSRSFAQLYQNYGAFEGNDKFRIIPNGLSFDEYLQLKDIPKKHKVVLIVSRLEETPKKLSWALKIWNIVKQNPMAKGWRLNIVGHGHSLPAYLRQIKQENIPDVCFLGRKDPVPYYKEASLFMMTSVSESWGLTLTEAQQFGVIPLAFDTYESLREIITDGENGQIIPPFDVQRYAQALINLMNDKARRESMAAKAIESSSRFSQRKIGEYWWKLFKSI